MYLASDTIIIVILLQAQTNTFSKIVAKGKGEKHGIRELAYIYYYPCAQASRVM